MSELLKDFESKDFVGQISILTQLGKEKDARFLPELFDLYDRLTGDKTVDAMIEHTIRDILTENEENTVKKLYAGTTKEKRLCLQVAGKNRFASAVSPIIELVKKETDTALLTTAFIAMSELKSRRFLNIFRENMQHPDEIIAGISIEMIGKFKDTNSELGLEKIIEAGESENRYETCAVATAEAIETLASLADDESIGFLVSKIHHRNPTARRMIQEYLVRMGEEVLPFFEDIWTDDDPDKKILTANTIARIGKKKGGDILLAALDKDQARTPNVRTAIYEAFGVIHSMKGLVCLADALDEEDLQVLITVVSSLDPQLNPGVTDKIKEKIERNDAHGDKLVRAVVSARAVKIFEQLYPFDHIREKLVDAALQSKDAEIIGAFIEKLERIPGTQSAADLDTLKSTTIEKAKLRVLVVEDSKPMRLFYRSILSRMGIEPTTAEHGIDALDKIETAEPFDLVITDLNMPVMDGIEFTRTIRSDPVYVDIPIIMGTTESDSSQKKLAEKSGINDFITKPIQPETLKEKINQYISN